MLKETNRKNPIKLIHSVKTILYLNAWNTHTHTHTHKITAKDDLLLCMCVIIYKYMCACTYIAHIIYVIYFLQRHNLCNELTEATKQLPTEDDI